MELNILLEAVPAALPLDHSTNIVWSIIAILASGLIGWVSSLITGSQERKKIKLQVSENNAKTSERDRLIMDQMKGFDNKLVEISMDLLEIKNDMSFKSRLLNSMRTVTTNIIDYNVDLDVKYKHVIMQMAREIEDFALRFYYSDMRGIKHEITPFLTIDMASRVSKMESYFHIMNPTPKKQLSLTGKASYIYYNKYIEPALKPKINILLNTLEVNGLTSDRVIEEFEKFISEFLKEYIKVSLEWEAIGKKVIEEKVTDMLNDDEIEEIRNEYTDKEYFKSRESIKNK